MTTTAELIHAYEEIIESLKPMSEDSREYVRMGAKIQIDRCSRSIRDLKNSP